jgi:hypothetical protein
MKPVNSMDLMRKCIMTIALSFLILQINAQTDKYENLPQFLFPQFAKSVLKMKAGKDISLMLNYNIVTEKMIFLQKDQVFELLNPESVDTALTHSKRFIPVGKVFYEVLIDTPVALFVQHKGKIVDPGKPSAYGGTSQVSSSTYITKLVMNNGSGVFNMALPDDLEISAEQVFWIRLENEKYGFENERQYLKIFQGKESEIKKFIKTNDIKFANPADVIKLVNYCSGLIK